MLATALLFTLAQLGHATSGLVTDPAGTPLKGVAVRSSAYKLTDTTDANGSWSLASTVGASLATTPGIRLVGNRILADLATPDRLEIDGFAIDGRSLFHRVENLGAGRHTIAIDVDGLHWFSRIRIRSRSGESILSAARAAAVNDTIRFRLDGYDPVDRILPTPQDTLLTVMTPLLQRPESLTVSDLNATTSTVSWSAIPRATGYIATISGAHGEHPRDTTLTTAGFLISNMVPGKAVRVRIRAVEGVRISDSSAGVATIHRKPLSPLLNGKNLDSVPNEGTPLEIVLTVPGWAQIRRLKVYNEATPFLDTTYQADDSVKITVGTKSVPLIDPSWIRIVALDSLGDSAHCRIHIGSEGLVAGWVIDSSNQATLVDRSTHGFDLDLKTTGVWYRAYDSSLIHSPKGRICYQARIFLDAYPDTTVYNKAEVVMGFYAGPRIAVTTRGQLMIVSQKGTDGVWSWYGPRSGNSTVPLKRWVTISIGVDASDAQLYAWIDGAPVKLWAPTANSGTEIRNGPWPFYLGNDSRNPQKFSGKILWANVWNRFLFTPGTVPGVDATIAD